MAEIDHHWSNPGFAEQQAVFKGSTQKVRALSEGWVSAHLFCPSCSAARLSALYPDNHNVRPKIRQQLQVLRDRGWLSFGGRGTDRRIGLG